MSEGEYSTEATLQGHTSPIVTLEFSPDGKFLASGANNGVVLIFSTSSWASLGNFVDASPVAAVTWYVGRRYLLLCGHESGDLHLMTFTGSVVSSSLLALPNPLTTTVGKSCRLDVNVQWTHPLSLNVPCIPLGRYRLWWRGSFNGASPQPTSTQSRTEALAETTFHLPVSYKTP